MIGELISMLGVLTGWVAILMPVLLIWVIFYFSTKNDKEKYAAMIEIAKNLEDPSDVEDLLENFKEKKKPIDIKIDENSFELSLRILSNEFVAIKIGSTNFSGKLIAGGILLLFFTLILLEGFGLNELLMQ